MLLPLFGWCPRAIGVEHTGVGHKSYRFHRAPPSPTRLLCFLRTARAIRETVKTYTVFVTDLNMGIFRQSRPGNVRWSFREVIAGSVKHNAVKNHFAKNSGFITFNIFENNIIFVPSKLRQFLCPVRRISDFSTESSSFL